MDALLEHFLGRAQQATGEDNDGCCTIASFDILCRRQVDELPKCNQHHQIAGFLGSGMARHFGSRMQSLNAFQDSRAIVCYDDLSLRCLDLG